MPGRREDHREGRDLIDLRRAVDACVIGEEILLHNVDVTARQLSIDQGQIRHAKRIRQPNGRDPLHCPKPVGQSRSRLVVDNEDQVLGCVEGIARLDVGPLKTNAHVLALLGSDGAGRRQGGLNHRPDRVLGFERMEERPHRRQAKTDQGGDDADHDQGLDQGQARLYSYSSHLDQ